MRDVVKLFGCQVSAGHAIGSQEALAGTLDNLFRQCLSISTDWRLAVCPPAGEDMGDLFRCGQPVAVQPEDGGDRAHGFLNLLPVDCLAVCSQPGQQIGHFLRVQWPARIDAEGEGKARVKVCPYMGSFTQRYVKRHGLL
jgi:hypothetical protein